MDKKFKFSIITAVYNVEKYLNESIESVINQSINFKDNVQLILVNDGSTDKSEKICLKYKEKYPENIVVLSKKNEGQSSARNLGLKYATGKYINFLDSDDKLSLNTLQEIDNFFKNNKNIKIIAIPLVFLNEPEKIHRLNPKFKETKIINVFETFNYPQLSAPSCFIHHSLIKNNEFNTNLNIGEDAVFINEILFDTKCIAFLNTAEYLYRKRDDLTSTLDDIGYKKEFYLNKLKYFHEELIKFSIDKLGYVPKFIQYLITYDLQWYYGKSQIKEVLNSKEYNYFMKKLQYILSYIDEDIILNHDFLKIKDKKNFLIFLKNNLEFNIDVKENNVFLKTKDLLLDNLNNNRILITNIDVTGKSLIISGKFSSYCKNDYLKIIAIKTSNENETEIIGKYNCKSSKITNCLDIDWKFVYNFDIEIPLEKHEEFELNFIVNYAENNNYSKIISPLNYKKFNDCKYLTKKSKKVILKEYSIIIENYPLKMKINEFFNKNKKFGAI